MKSMHRNNVNAPIFEPNPGALSFLMASLFHWQ